MNEACERCSSRDECGQAIAVDMNEMTMGDIRNMGAEHTEGVCTRGAEPNVGHAVYVHLIRSVRDVIT